MKKNEKYQNIFLVSHRLFLSQGYETATIRQISDEAGVSLGLTNHFFHSKQQLAALVLCMISDYVGYQCAAHCPTDDLLLSSALSTRAAVLYMLRGPYRRFYLDSLKHDIFLHRPQKEQELSLYPLSQIYGFPPDHDLFLLYETYIPYNYEKTLIQGKENGLFPTISYKEIPDYIMISRFEHFIDTEILNKALLQAHKEADKILPRIPEVVPDEFLMEFLEEGELR